MPRTLRIITVLLLSLSLGFHWAVLQSVAWTAMLIERTQCSSFTVAVKTTFDGQHPCRLCKVVHEGKKAEQKSPVNGKNVKLELLALDNMTPSLQPPRFTIRPESPVLPICGRSDAPDFPPPRV